MADFSSEIKYLMTWRDLGPEHLPELIQLRSDVLEHLSEVYGVSEGELKEYDLQFHTTTAMRNPVFGSQRSHFMTLHLQIGVNHCWTLSCMSRHISLDEIIRRLQSSGRVCQEDTQFFFEDSRLQLAERMCVEQRNFAAGLFKLMFR